MSAEGKRDYNLAAKVFLGLAILSFVLGCVSNLINYSTYYKLGLGSSQSHMVIEAIFDVLLVVAAVFVFKRNKYALIAFLALAIIRMFATIPQGTDVSTAYYLGGKSVVLLRDVGLFCLAMFFRNNGITGWQSFFADDSFIESHFQTAEEQTIVEEPNNETTTLPSAAIEENEKKIIEKEVVEIDVVAEREPEPIVSAVSPTSQLNETVEKKSPSITPVTPISEPTHLIRVDSERVAELQKRVIDLEEENAKLKEMYAELALELSLMKKKK